MATNALPTSPSSDRQHATPIVYLYLSILAILVLTPGGLVNTPLQFIYKNQLHLDAAQTAIYKVIINSPGYVAFLFGVCRDRFNPLRMGDRGFILIFAGLSGLIWIGVAETPLTRTTLAVGLILWGISTGLVGASFQAMMRNIAEVRMMSGRMSTTYQFLSAAIPMVALFAGGWLTEHLAWKSFLYLTALLYLSLGVFAVWKPRDIFDGLKSGGDVNLAAMKRDIKLLFKLRGFWLAVTIWGLWAFAPAGVTPLMFYLTDHLKMGPTAYGSFNALFNGAAIPTVLLFGFLCKRMSLWKLLIISTLIGIPQWMPVMFIHTPTQALVIAAAMGAAGGLGNGAYFSLLLRACPEGLAGTGMLVAGSFALIVTEAGNVLGGYIYNAWGFFGCGIATVAAYCLLLPLCLLLPRALVNPRDDQPVPAIEELVA